LIEPNIEYINNNGLLKLPSNVNDTLIALNTIDILTNKTLVEPIILSLKVNNNVLYFPDITDTLISQSSKDVLYNKSLINPHIEIITTKDNSNILIPQTSTPDEFILKNTNQDIYNKKLYDCVLDNAINIDNYILSSITFPSE
jgi:hypothetical protein